MKRLDKTVHIFSAIQGNPQTGILHRVAVRVYFGFDTNKLKRLVEVHSQLNSVKVVGSPSDLYTVVAVAPLSDYFLGHHALLSGNHSR
jgi:hypothetical protein